MQAILIVEADESIRRILDLSLRHAGFAVGLASTNEEALRRLADGPDLVIAGAIDTDGLAFCRRVKQTGERLPPAVVLISEPGLESKTRGLEAGADDFVVKPIYVQEVVARARALLQRRERERLELSAHAAGAPAEGAEAPAPRGDRFVSDISDVPLVDLLRAIAAHQKSGVAVISADGGARGEIFFRQGNVVDAEVGRLSGRDAIYRLFCWSSGQLEVEWKSIRRKDTIEMRPQDLLMEALRRVDEWRRLLAGLPPLDTIFEVDYRTLAERLADIPDEVNRILRLFDGVRTFLQVIDDCGLPDLDAAASIGKLVQERIIHDIRLPLGEDEAVGADMEGWLSEATGPFRSPARLERDLFGASPEAGIGVHGRPTAPLEPLEGATDPLDDDLRAVGGQLEIEPRTERLVAEPELHHLRLDDHAPPLQQRQEIARVFAPDVDSDAAGPLVLEACEQPDRVPIRRRMLVLRDEQRARQERDPVLGIEQRDGQPAARAACVADRLHLKAVFDLLGRRRDGLGQPRIDPGSARDEAPRRLRRMVRRLHRPRPRALAASSFTVDSCHVHRSSVHRVVHTVGRWRRRGRPTLRAARLVAQRDQQRRDVLAMAAVARSERRARTARRETAGRKLERDLVGIRIGPAHVAPSPRVLDDDVLDRVPPDVVVAAEVGTGAEQTPQRAIVQSGQCFGER